MSQIDYDNDVIKHHVRLDGWLKAYEYRSKQVRRATNGGRRSRPLTYFTFCASNAIDIFMLERAKLIRREKKSSRVENVYFCESKEEDFQKIVSLLGSAEAGFMEQFEEFVLFQDDENT